MKPVEQFAEDTQNGGTTVWAAETPFLDPMTLPTGVPRNPIPPASQAFGPREQEVDGPFLSSWGTGPERILGPKGEAFARFMAEAYEPEFEAAYQDLVNDASAFVADRFSYETDNPIQLEADATEGLREYLDPLRRQAEAIFDRALAAGGERDTATLTEAEVEALVDIGPSAGIGSPVFENFLKKLIKKAKRVVKAAAKIAKKIGKVIPLGAVLDKLKKLVKPLIEKVLTAALHKLPEPVQPLAIELAKKMLGIDLSPPGGEPAADAGADATAPDQPQAAAAPPAAAVEDIDARLAGATIEGDQFLRELEMAEFAARPASPSGSPLHRLDRARAEFARRIVALQPGEAAEPVFEAFLPAVLTAAKIGVRLVGREKVVNFIAKHMARLMGRFIGQRNAQALAAPLTSAGMSLIGLEASEADPTQVGYALASTVEGTVARLASAPPSVFNSEVLLEAYTTSALEKAAAAALPDETLKETARETANQPGVWMPMPPENPAKRYKKYSRVIDVTLTPQVASDLMTFGGIPLSTMLRDCAGVKVDRPLRAKLHLYEAQAGTTLSGITSQEKKVRGLGTEQRRAWVQLFPFTTKAAGALVGENRLGTDVDSRFLQNPNLIAVGQRFAYLEFPREASVQPPGSTVTPEASHTGLLLDVPNGVIVLRFFYSEADATEIVRHLRGGAPIAAVIKALTAGRDLQLRALFSGAPTPHLRLVNEATPIHGQIPDLSWKAMQWLGEPLATQLIGWTLEALKGELEGAYQRFVDQFARAVEAPEDGVTLLIAIRVPAVLEALKGLLSGGPIRTAAELIGALGRVTAEIRVELRPGNVRG